MTFTEFDLWMMEVPMWIRALLGLALAAIGTPIVVREMWREA